MAVGLTTCGYDEADWPMLDAATRAWPGAIADFDRVGASFISHDRGDADNPASRKQAMRGVPVLCWTVRPRTRQIKNLTFLKKML